jgi:hypothetical protein
VTIRHIIDSFVHYVKVPPWCHADEGIHSPSEEHLVYEAPPRQRSGVRIQISCVAAVSSLRSSGRGPHELQLGELHTAVKLMIVARRLEPARSW